MKKILILAIVVIAIIVIGIRLSYKYSPTIVSKQQDIMIVKYTASYSNCNILNSVEKYEIVDNLKRLKSILDNAKNNNYDDRFTTDFFNENSLLVIQGVMDSKIHKKSFTIFRAMITIYTATPLSNENEEYEFDLYLIPVDKAINHVELTIEAYPNRTY